MTNQLPTIRAVFEQALECASDADRKDYLDATCEGDPQMRERVDALLAAHAAASGFLEEPICADTGISELDSESASPGASIGPYVLVKKIGEGGFGVVFLAQQEQPVRREVALKIIKPGMDTRQVIARFEAERQALAMMDHPSIAKVLDAGTTDSGRPYFVMELVKGVPITKYCDEKLLSVRDRLRLFIAVCQAVQHAHQKGVIHRDIKPTNVLVAEYDHQPMPKIIDFGVAKATAQKLTERTMFTEFGQVIGTVDYMSPEQAKFNQLDIDTRSDIYSLGVLLYELLAGSTPFDQKRLREAAFDEMLRIIREEEPPRPSARLTASDALPSIAANRQIDPARLGKDVQGELDWIVMKALDKDRNRRYETASAFAADVERQLNDEPVRACPPSTGYRLRKFARKYRTVLGTISAIGTLLIVATIGAILAAVQSSRLAEKEQELRNSAEQKAAAESEARRELDRRLYVNRVALAQQELFAQNPGHAQELLEECPSSMRDWEWFFLKRFRPGNPLIVDGPRYTNVVAFSPDGTRLSTKNAEGTVDVVDTRTGQSVLNIPVGGMHGIAFSPIVDDAVLAIPGHNDQLVRIWDLKNGKEARSLQGHTDRLRDVAFSPNGQRLASGGYDGVLKVWDWRTGQPLFGVKVARSGVSKLAFSPDGRRIAAGVWGDEKEVVIVDAETGKIIRSFGEHSGGIEGVAYSPDGKSVATCAYDGTIKIWNEDTGKLAKTLRGHTGAVHCVVFSPNGRRLASAGWDKTVKIWDADTGQVTITLRGHTDAVTTTAFSNDGHLLASTGYDGTRIWNATPLDETAELEAHDLPGHTSAVKSVAFSPDGRLLASAGLDRMINLWEVSSFGKQTKASSRPLRGHADMVTSVAFNADSNRLASCGWDQTVKVWDLTDARPLASTTVGNDLESVAFSPDRRRLASLGPEKLIIWDAATGEQLAVHLTRSGDTSSLAYSPDGSRLAYCAHKAVRICDGETAEEVHAVELPARTTAIAYSPDGRRLASASNDRLVRVYDTANWEEIRKLRGHSDRVTSVAFSSDGRHLASGSADSSVKVWDAERGRELTTFRGHTGYVWGVAFSPDGKRLSSAGGHENNGEVKVWNLADALAATEDPERAEATRRQLIEFYEMLATTQPKVWEHRSNLGHAYAQDEQWDEAAGEYAKAIDLNPAIYAEVVDMFNSAVLALDSTKRPREADNARLQAAELASKNSNHLNALAWQFATSADVSRRDPSFALALAKKAVELEPNSGPLFNTLGVAHYRAENWHSAIESLSESMARRNGGDSFDWFFLAMAHHQLEQRAEARRWYDKAVDWMSMNHPKNEELQRFRAEAAALIGVAEPKT